ncbi:MAG: tRNA (N(6)-L-threonylcarbamoyladenosine(37)-C(2))-methylthiotransferase MtaB [Deltaproteobacteria bacterium]|nr:tRNA (N(6)-L-threonylcarbamoyladenosine(37)-C(2))-methylthiotransferase MtaB [Deltaproteobacteria bacterium]
MRIAITTLGCKINQYDSAVIQSRLVNQQNCFVPFGEQADFYIINTCTVTDRADWEARQLVRRVKRLSPASRVLITGCYAQVNPEQVAQLPGVDFVVGLNRLDDLARFVDAAERQPDGIGVSVGDVKRERRVQVLGARELPGHTRAFLKIQEGCNYSCAYCIIPTARGLSRSVPPEQVLAQVRALAEKGFVEVVLTGIHLGGYGQELKPKMDLTSLLEMIVERRLVPRLRLSSLDPREVPQRLLRLMAQSDILCPHLHVCAQAGEDRILKRMRRNYDTAFYRDILTAAREALPDAALGSDIIVGFPGEGDDDFCHSLEFFDSLPLTYFHVFPYSARARTAAAELPGQVLRRIRKERARRMRDLGAKKKMEFYRRFIGRSVPVLVERAADRESGACKGRSRNYLPVLVQADERQINREVPVAIEGLEGSWLKGSRVEGLKGSNQHGSCQQSA